jgi:hypothetical protein
MAPAGVAAVDAGASRVFLLVECDDGGDAATLRATDGGAAWTGSLAAPAGEAAADAWLSAATDTMLGRTVDGAVAAARACDGRLDVDATWPLALGGGLRGVARVALAPDADPGPTRAAILLVAVDAAAAAVAAASSLRESGAALAAAAAAAHALAERTAAERREAEEALLAKFVVVLNSKKAECARLQARLDGGLPPDAPAYAPASSAGTSAAPAPTAAPAGAPPADGAPPLDEPPASATDSGPDSGNDSERQESAAMDAGTE